MKNLNLTFVAILFAFFALTSCEKESMNEMTETTNIATSTETVAATTPTAERSIPAEGIQTFNEAAQTLATKKVMRQMAQSRSKTATFIYDITRPVYGTTVGESNYLNSRNAPCLDRNGEESFDGRDAIYAFEVEEEEFKISDLITTYNVVLSDLGADLDLFVYTLDAYGYINECKGSSQHYDYAEEKIDLGELKPGYYYIVVDGWMQGVEGEFTLQVNKKTKNTYRCGPDAQTIKEVIFGDASDSPYLQKHFSMNGTTSWAFVQSDGSIENYQIVSATETVLIIENITVSEIPGYKETITRTMEINTCEYSINGAVSVMEERANEPEVGRSSVWYSNVFEIN